MVYRQFGQNDVLLRIYSREQCSLTVEFQLKSSDLKPKKLNIKICVSFLELGNWYFVWISNNMRQRSAKMLSGGHVYREEFCTLWFETMNNICVRLTANQDEVCRHLANSGGCLEQNYKVVTGKIFWLLFNV